MARPTRVARAAAALTAAALAACGGDGPAEPTTPPPASLGISPELQPIDGSLFFDTGSPEINAKYGGSTIRQWYVLDPDGFASATIRSGLVESRLLPAGRWSIESEALVVRLDSGGLVRARPGWLEPDSARILVPRPSIDPGFYMRAWSGADPESNMAGLFTLKLDESLRRCEMPEETGRFWWSGSLRLDPDGAYGASLVLMRRCTGSGLAQDSPVVSGHVLERLRAGRWSLGPSGRQLVFDEKGGERFVTRLDGVKLDEFEPRTRMCVDGALLASDADPQALAGFMHPRSVDPVRGNLPLVLDEDAGCLPPPFDGGRMSLQDWIELAADGTATGEGLAPFAAGRAARWSVDAQTLSLLEPGGVAPFVLRKRWVGLRPGPRIAPLILTGRWEPRSTGQIGFFGGLVPVTHAWSGSVEFRADGSYQAALGITATMPASGTSGPLTSAHPLTQLVGGRWALDEASGTLMLQDDRAGAVSLRVSQETPGTGSSEALLGSATPRLQIDTTQFVPAAP